VIEEGGAVADGVRVVQLVAALVPVDFLGIAGGDVALGLLLVDKAVVACKLQKQRRGGGLADVALGVDWR
jgi:hypothetical protein